MLKYIAKKIHKPTCNKYLNHNTRVIPNCNELHVNAEKCINY